MNRLSRTGGMPDPLPIDDVIDDIRGTLRERTCAILVAPPGAGKTTMVPLALLEEDFLQDRSIKVIEPRRLAAKAAAERMADLLSEDVGKTVGYQVRLERRISRDTRIEVVTDGVFRRQILEDPELTGVGAVLFDEFHERSLDTDFAFALIQDVREALRQDLRVLIMSATLDAAGLSARLGGAPVIESEGRLHPVETRYRVRPPNGHLEDHVADAVLDAVRNESGSVLCFLPGQREISRTAERLRNRLPPAVTLHQLSGSLDRKLQDEAIRPARSDTRKVVLATAIAETSLTIEGVRVVVDCGLSRVARFDPGSQMTRLETVRAPRSSIDQRRGRAGRTEPGLCIRLWHEGQTGSLPAKPDPDIRQTDLTQLVLDLAAWGVTDPDRLLWLDPPPREAWDEASALLIRIGALGTDGTITAHGRSLGAYPLHPRLGHMIVEAGENQLSVVMAADIAALLSEPGLTGRDLDLRERLRAFRSGKSRTVKALRQQAASWVKGLKPEGGGERSNETLAGIILSFAYPDRIAQSRGKLQGRERRFKLSNGKGCSLDLQEPLSEASYLVVAEIAGNVANARVRLAAPIELSDIVRVHGQTIVREEKPGFDENRMAAVQIQADKLGALVLKQSTRAAEPCEATSRLLVAEITKRGFQCLPFDTNVDEFCARIGFLRENGGAGLPALTSDGLLESLSDWLEPFLAGAVALADVKKFDFDNALDLSIGHDAAAMLGRDAPLRWVLPGGGTVRIDYRRESGPGIDVKPHEVFGTNHPAILDGGHPLTVTLLSPAGRPIQVTRDLPGFWAGSWKDVRTELRARYPKHFWPEDPTRETPSASSIKRKRPDG